MTHVPIHNIVVINNYGITNNTKFLPNMRGIIIKSNNWYYNPNSSKGHVGASFMQVI